MGLAAVAPVAFEGAAPDVTSSMTELTTVASNVMSIISGNQLLFTLWCASLFFVGIGIVKALKKAAKK